MVQRPSKHTAAAQPYLPAEVKAKRGEGRALGLVIVRDFDVVKMARADQNTKSSSCWGKTKAQSEARVLETGQGCWRKLGGSDSLRVAKLLS